MIFLTSNHCFWLIFFRESSIQNFYFCSEKVIPSESGEKDAQIKLCLQEKTVQNSYGGQQEIDFFTGGSIIMDYGLRSNSLKMS